MAEALGEICLRLVDFNCKAYLLCVTEQEGGATHDDFLTALRDIAAVEAYVHGKNTDDNRRARCATIASRLRTMFPPGVETVESNIGWKRELGVCGLGPLCVRGDGNCAFRAVAGNVLQDTNMHGLMRQIGVAFHWLGRGGYLEDAPEYVTALQQDFAADPELASRFRWATIDFDLSAMISHDSATPITFISVLMAPVLLAFR
eukprot:scaffold242196_cov17-Prasinocladus_malaysianus.AAC.2